MEQSNRPTDRITEAERREHERVRVRHGSFAALCPRFTVIGQIMDISLTGLSFRYVASRARTKESSELTILATDGSLDLGKISFRTIWDWDMPQQFSLGSITLRQCGVQFRGLTHKQRLDLQYFISRYGTGRQDEADLLTVSDKTRSL